MAIIGTAAMMMVMTITMTMMTMMMMMMMAGTRQKKRSGHERHCSRSVMAPMSLSGTALATQAIWIVITPGGEVAVKAHQASPLPVLPVALAIVTKYR